MICTYAEILQYSVIGFLWFKAKKCIFHPFWSTCGTYNTMKHELCPLDKIKPFGVQFSTFKGLIIMIFDLNVLICSA